jgi:hypothetical protein
MSGDISSLMWALYFIHFASFQNPAAFRMEASGNKPGHHFGPRARMSPLRPEALHRSRIPKAATKLGRRA